MDMFRIDFNVRPLLDRLAQARAELNDPTPIHKDIASYMETATRNRFETGTAPDGRRWRQKSPTTLAGYLRRGDGNKPRPLIGSTGRLGREIHSVADSEAAEIGSSLIYSGVMQLGAKKASFGRSPWGDIPARPFLGISSDDERTIISIVDDHLSSAVED